MDEEKEDLKSIKVYKFNNTMESWHEFALEFRVIADSRGYDGIIDGSVSPPDEKETIEITTEDKGDVLKVKKKIKGKRSQQEGLQGPCYVHCGNLIKHCGECHI